MSATDNILPRIDLNIDFNKLPHDLAQDYQLSAFLSGLNFSNLVGKQDDQKVLYGSEATYYQKLLNKVPALNLENNNLPLEKTETQGSPGTYCANFHLPGISEPVFDYSHNDAIELDDGSILTCGANTIANMSALAKFDSFGRIDRAFGGNTGFFNDNNVANLIWRKIVRTKQNSYYLIGDNSLDIYIAKVNPEDGSYDTSFGIEGILVVDLGGIDVVYDASLQPDGKLLLCGFRAPEAFVARLDLNAEALDLSFNGVGWISLGFGGFIAILYNIKFYQGKIYTAGDAAPAFVSFPVLARLNLNGTLDTTFNGTGFNIINVGSSGEAWGLSFQSDGKPVISGSSTVGVTFDSFAARFNSSGVLDATYGVAGIYKLTILAPFERVLRRCVIDKDDNLYVFGNGREGILGGHFFLLIKLDSNGVLNASFNNGAGYLLKYLGLTDSQSYGIILNDSLSKLLLVNYYNINGGIYRSIVSKVNI